MSDTVREKQVRMASAVSAEEPLLTVVIPAFQAARHLQCCLDSLRHTGVDSVEVIVVDDGSTDETAELVRRHQRLYPEVRLMRTRHSGPGHARNRGVSVAKGRFLAFVDADDVIPRGAFGRLLDVASRDGADIVVGRIVRFGGEAPVRKAFPHMGSLSSGPIRWRTDPALLTDTVVTGKLYRRSFWRDRNLTFPEWFCYEDMPVVMHAHLISSQTSFFRGSVYRWRRTPGSITRSEKTGPVIEGWWRSLLFCHEQAEDLLDESGLLIVENELARRGRRWLKKLFRENADTCAALQGAKYLAKAFHNPKPSDSLLELVLQHENLINGPR